MSTTTIERSALERAREEARNVLRRTPEFRKLPLAEQKDMYLSMVRAIADDIRRDENIVRAMAPVAGDLIRDERHLNRRIDQLGDIAGDFVEAVNFPKFVADLLKGVFDANLAVTLQQMQAYQGLLKTATAAISKFVKDIDDTAAFGYLAENESDSFNLDFSDDDKTETNPDGAVLTDKEGNKLDIGDNEVKAKIMEAKIAMAREQRALLRETILMGVTRLVVEKGNVKAGVIFDFKATEQIKKADKAGVQRSRSAGGSMSADGGFIGRIIGGPSGGHTWSTKESQITVASAKSEANTSLAAKLTGSVDITFRSDFFKLDNFATMYGPITQGAAPATGAGGPAQAGGAPALPAPAAPAAARPAA